MDLRIPVHNLGVQDASTLQRLKKSPYRHLQTAQPQLIPTPSRRKAKVKSICHSTLALAPIEPKSYLERHTSYSQYRS